MPKSCTGSRYTARSSTSSRLRKVASAITGPGVTTWRLVSISPRSASITNPVAWADTLRSVSKERVWSIWIVTTLVAIRSRVLAQSAGGATSLGTGTITGGSGGGGGGFGVAQLAIVSIVSMAPAAPKLRERHNARLTARLQNSLGSAL